MSACHEILGLKNYTLDIWLFVAQSWLIGASLALFIGGPGILAAGKKGIALGASAALAFLLWISSVPNTSGGVIYTWRILTPAWVTLSIAAGAFGYLLLRTTNAWRKYLQAGAVLAFVICGGYAIVCCWAQPSEAGDIGRAVFSMRKDPLDSYSVFIEIAESLEKSKLPAVKLLTEDCNLAVALERYSRFQPVMEWSPEVAFLFDPKLTPAEAKQRLLDKNICFVAVSYSSVNNYYLLRYPFFKEGFQAWKPVLALPIECRLSFCRTNRKSVPIKHQTLEDELEKKPY